MGNRESWVDTFVARDVIMESKLPPTETRIYSKAIGDKSPLHKQSDGAGF